MKVIYLLNGTTLCGGVKVVFEHVRILRGLGIDAKVVSDDRPGSWLEGAGELHQELPALTAKNIGPVDVAVGTFWTTVPLAHQVARRSSFHFCQGFEASYEPFRSQWAAIEATYRLPTRKLVVSPHLVSLIRSRFGQDAAWIPQPFAAGTFTPPQAEPDGSTFRLLLPGEWSVAVKGVAWAMRALRPLVDESPRLVLVRLTPEAPPAEERAAWDSAEYHTAIAPCEVPPVYQGVHVFLGASNRLEGFGLPTLEAMGCGRACALTEIGSFQALDPERRASLPVRHGDDEGLRQAIRQLRDDPGLRHRLGQAGRRIAGEFSQERTGRELIREIERGLRGGNDDRRTNPDPARRHRPGPLTASGGSHGQV